jgi:hypothetical protein
MTTRNISWALPVAAAMLTALPAANAQTAASKDDAAQKNSAPAPQASRKIRSVRKSVVDLEALAKERRPGQVMPGDPTPVLPAPIAARPAPSEETHAPVATPAAPVGPPPSTIQLPDTAPSTRNIVKPESSADGRTSSIEPPAPSLPPAPPSPLAEELHSTPGAMAASSLPQSPKGEPIAAIAAAASSAPKTSHAEPLPQMEPSKPETTSPAPVAEAPATLVDKTIIPNIPMALSSGPAKIHVDSIPGAADLQWRVPGEAWKTPAAGDTTESKIEFRGGLEAEIVLIVDERVQIRVSRLGRGTIERSAEVGGASAVSLTLSRGVVEIKPVKGATIAPGEMLVRVRTPDQMFGVTGALRIEYEAFTGTRRRSLNP